MRRLVLLAALQHEAFSRHARPCPVPLALHVLHLLTFDKRALADSTAVCLLRRRWGRSVAVVTMLSAVSTAAGAAGPVPAALWALLVLSVLGAGAGSRCSGYSKGRAGRREAKGTGVRAVYVHGVASNRRGHGERLMRGLAHEADRRGWALALDVDSAVLIDYYRRFGFRLLGEGTATGARMWRPVGGSPKNGAPCCSPERDAGRCPEQAGSCTEGTGWYPEEGDANVGTCAQLR